MNYSGYGLQQPHRRSLAFAVAALTRRSLLICRAASPPVAKPLRESKRLTMLKKKDEAKILQYSPQHCKTLILALIRTVRPPEHADQHLVAARLCSPNRVVTFFLPLDFEKHVFKKKIQSIDLIFNRPGLTTSILLLLHRPSRSITFLLSACSKRRVKC